MPKNHKQNSNFQITYFLAGSCHTADEAYSMLCDLKEGRESVIKHYEITLLKEKARKIRAGKWSIWKSKRLENKAELLEIENNSKQGKILYEAALDELNHINKCIEVVQPKRKYKDYPDLKAHELGQQEEWKLELIHRAENYMLTSGSIPADHFVTMRMHPEFKEVILPQIEKILKITASKISVSEMVKSVGQGKKKFELPLLIDKA